MSPPTEKADKMWPAPAKINLFLHVTGRCADGYHDLQTLFQLLDWGDELRFTINDNGRVSRSCNVDITPEEDDICVHAARLLQRHSGTSSGVHIDLNKRIPTGGGLGGGSSDAATTLLVLNRLWSCGQTTGQLAGLGLELGADVPVFVHGHSAWAEGRGERLQSMNLDRKYYLLVFPDFGVSTARVFNYPDLKRDTKPVELQRTGLVSAGNDCEAVARKLYPELEVIMQDLQQWGQPRMSGTGSTVFLEYADRKAANSAASELKCRYNVCAVGGVNRSPVLDELSAWR